MELHSDELITVAINRLKKLRGTYFEHRLEIKTRYLGIVEIIKEIKKELEIDDIDDGLF